ADPLVAREVEELFTSLENAGDFLKTPVPALFGFTPALPRGRIGPYELLEEIGRGGMATVFLARRADGFHQMPVAVKLLSLVRSGRDLERMFRTEVEILSQLRHPYIVQLLDGGTTDDGALYLVTEYVNGETIVDHCRARFLSISERLKLFACVCEA